MIIWINFYKIQYVGVKFFIPIQKSFEHANDGKVVQNGHGHGHAFFALVMVMVMVMIFGHGHGFSHAF